MTITKKDLETMLQAAALAGYQANIEDFEIANLEAGKSHNTPPHLKPKSSAVYMFFHKNSCLYVGKVGKNSKARFQSQHYNEDSSRSNLSKSLLNDEKYPQIIGALEPGEWLKKNTNRCNILIPIKYGKNFVNFVEAFFALKLQPKFSDPV